MRLLAAILLVLLLVPDWTGEERLPLLDRDAHLLARRVDPDRRQWGALRLVGVWSLASEAPGFQGFSALALHRGRLTLLSDGGNWVGFAVRGQRPVAVRAGYLPSGPGTGWEKRDRDSESLALDPATGRLWVGFEGANAIWRFAPGFARAEGQVQPPAMRKWPVNGGPEAMARLSDGRFVVIAERGRKRRFPRPALLFAGDPVSGVRAIPFGFRPPAGYDPSDVTELPNGDLLVLTRRWRFPIRFSAKLVRVRRGAIRKGVVVSGREIATLDGALGENWEGVTAVRDGGHTTLWMVTDQDQPLFQRTLLAKFRLD